MTREEAIARIRNHKIVHKMNEPRAIYISEALDMAIKALEQEPIDMDMTKALILGLLLGIDKNPDEKDKLMEDLVKVFAPKQKMGHWIEVTNGRGGHECNICHEYAPSYQDGDEYLTDYCPNCGCRMVEPKGSEG